MDEAILSISLVNDKQLTKNEIGWCSRLLIILAITAEGMHPQRLTFDLRTLAIQRYVWVDFDYN